MAHCRSRRSVERVDYKKLSDGPSIKLQFKGNQPQSWSSKTLFPLTIIDNKLDDNGTLLVKVHYAGWDAKFDEWRPATDVIEIPETFLVSETEAKERFFSQLRVAVKESLHCQKKTDSHMDIKLPVIKDIFQEFQSLGKPHPKLKGRFILENLSDLNVVLGDETWFIRIINRAGDFAYIIKGTIEFWLSERVPLEDYTPGGALKLIHRGFSFNLRYVKGKANRFDYDEIMKELVG